MSVGEDYLGIASSTRVKEEIGPIYLLAFVFRGPSIARAVTIRDKGGSDSGVVANISGR